MQEFRIMNFQDLYIRNALTYNKPFEETGLSYEESLTVVIIRDPYAYFDTMLSQYIHNEMSPGLAQETLHALDVLDDQAFLKWFDTLHYLPMINPQTFHMDMRKTIESALANLEIFDYVVPYEKLDEFTRHVSPDLKVETKNIPHLPFSLASLKEHELTEVFIGKDLQLYSHAQKLWEHSESNQFKSLKSLIPRRKPTKKRKGPKKKRVPYHGIVGQIDDTSIKGWVYHKEDPESITIGVYLNGELLKKVKADIMRADIKELKGHPTGLCGFNLTFEPETFQKGDKVEVKTFPDGFVLPFGTRAKSFLSIT